MLPAVMAGIALGQGLYANKANNSAVKAQNDSILKHMGKQLGDIALQEQQQITQLREASISNKRQGKQASATARLASYTADTFGASVDEQQMEIARQLNETEAKIERSEENVQDSTRRAIESAVDSHASRVQRLSGAGGMFRAVLGAGDAYLKYGGKAGGAAVYSRMNQQNRSADSTPEFPGID